MITKAFTSEEEAMLRAVFGSQWSPSIQSHAVQGTIYLERLSSIRSPSKRSLLSIEDIQRWERIRRQYMNDIRPDIRALAKTQNPPQVSQLMSQLQSLEPLSGPEETDVMMVIVLASIYRRYVHTQGSSQQSLVLYFRGIAYPLATLDINSLVWMGDTEQDTGSDREYRYDWNALCEAVLLPDKVGNKGLKGKRGGCDVM
jgi:hypothetical protein